MTLLNKIKFVRFFHPGFNNNSKIALPLCPNNIKCNYYNHVWGNKIQEIQINKEMKNYYKTNEINFYSKEISYHFQKYNQETIFLPTSHNTPVLTALCSCRNLNTITINFFYSKLLKMNVLDNKKLFINNQPNRQKILSYLNNLLNQNKLNKNDHDILTTAMYGIFSNFADSIYIANDYLNVGNNCVIISNYSNKSSQREIEKARIIATMLKYGKYPIILDNNVNFEGEANVKFLPCFIYEDNQKYQLALTYESSRSESSSIANINKYLKKLQIPMITEIRLKPKKGLEEIFYHQDCIINFYCNNNIQNFNNIDDFYKNYKKNGYAVVIKDGFEEREINILEKIFDKIFFINSNDDLLGANMIVNKNGIVGSSKLNTNLKNKISANFPFFYNFVHPSSGGGGAHKCCSNIIKEQNEISINNWISFSKNIGININNNLLFAVKEEQKRLFL